MKQAKLKLKVVILDDNPFSIASYMEEHPELFKPQKCRCHLVAPKAEQITKNVKK